MAETESGQEKTEQATGKRLQDAREKGQVPRSKDLGTTVLMLAGGAMFLFSGGYMMSGLQAIVVRALTPDRSLLFEDPYKLPRFLLGMFGDGLLVIAPFLLAMAIAALVSPLSVGGWNFSTEAMGLKAEKLDPIKGFKRIFSLKGLIELPKTLAKFLVVSVVAVFVLRFFSKDVMRLGMGNLESDLVRAGDILVWGFLFMACALILIAAVDVPFQLWDHAKEMRMAKQELKDEHKNTEGNPEIKGRVRRMQMEMSQRRMMAEVPRADVIVTNPTHFAVALRYEQGRAGVPRVVAKGADLLAAQIRETAIANGIPIFSAPPLARALYFSVRLGQEIPAGLYVAVAQVLAYVYQLRAAVDLGGVAPAPPADLPVPEEFLRKAPPL